MLLWVFLDSLRVFVCYFAFSPLRLSKFSLWPLLSLGLAESATMSREVSPIPPERLRGYLEGGFPVTYWEAIREEGEA